MKDFIAGKSIYLRLARLEDMAELLRLRREPHCHGKLKPVEDDLKQQCEWFRAYQLREATLEERYFLICWRKDDHVCGALRVLDVDRTVGSFRLGSWVVERGAKPDVALQSTVLIYDELFGSEHFQLGRLEVLKGNHSSLRFHPRLGAKVVGETETEIEFHTTRADYFKARPRYARWLEATESQPAAG